MSDRLSPSDFGLKLYNRFPAKYREDDADQKYALRRYLEAAADGGFKYIIEEQNGILDLIDPQSCSVKVLYMLYEQYGLDLFHGIPEDFLRAFLPNLGLAWSKKGSLDVVEFIVSSLSGIKTDTKVTYDDYGNPLVTVTLEMDFSVSDYFPDTQQFERILENFIPFYCDALIIYQYVYEEFGDLQATDFDFFDIFRYEHEVANIPHSKGSRYYPTLNEDNTLLNDGFVLNEGFTIDHDPDELVIDIIRCLYDESGNIGSQYATLYKPALNMYEKWVEQVTKLHEALNTDLVFNKDIFTSEADTWEHPPVLLNHNLFLTEFVETDSYMDIVKYAPVMDTQNMSGADSVKDNVHLSPVEDSTRFGYGSLLFLNESVLNEGTLGEASLDEYEDKFIYTHDDSGSLAGNLLSVPSESGEVSSVSFAPTLNVGAGLNELILNAYREVDSHEDRFKISPVKETGKVSPGEEVLDNVSHVYEESGVIRSFGVQDLLNEDTDIELAYGNNADLFTDHITLVIHDGAVLMGEPEHETVMNDTRGELNSFILNGFVGYDIITTKKGNKEVVFN